MITHYLKVALRNLVKYRTQSVISVLGLAIGLAFFVFGLYWLRYETSYDNFYPDAGRSYLVYVQAENNKSGYSPSALADFIRERLPEAEIVTRSYEGGNGNMDYRFDETTAKNPNFMAVDSLFIRIFPQMMVCGRTLEREDEIIVSESFAKQHFRRPEKALDVMLHPSVCAGERGLMLMKTLVRMFHRNGGSVIQFTVFSAEELRDAQKNPEKYENLQVRVCGWNVRWNDLSKAEQDAYILRAENIMR